MVSYDEAPSVEEAEETLRMVEDAQKPPPDTTEEGLHDATDGGITDEVS